MKTIKFSHKDYFKLKILKDIETIKTVKLLQVIKIHYNDLSKDFITYDTKYDIGKYPLPKTELILLIFLHFNGLFTTIRRYTPQKWDYYKQSEGEIFKLEITGVK